MAKNKRRSHRERYRSARHGSPVSAANPGMRVARQQEGEARCLKRRQTMRDGEFGFSVSTKDVVERIGSLLDLAGVLVIVVGVAIASVIFVYRSWQTRRVIDVYRPYRQGVGRAILLGLELLVAADIIRTVAVSPTFHSVGVLALLVAVRTFLSFSLEVEIEGRWPWQAKAGRSASSGSGESRTRQTPSPPGQPPPRFHS